MRRFILTIFLIILFLLPVLAKADLNEGLVAYYPFDGNAKDMSGNGYDGSEHGGVTYVNGIIGEAASFDGVNGYINITSTKQLDVENIKTICLWFEAEKKKDNDYNAIISKYSSDTLNEDGWIIVLDKDGNIRSWIKDGSGTLTSEPPSACYNYNLWTFFCMKIDSNLYVTSYVNGEKFQMANKNIKFLTGNKRDVLIGVTQNQWGLSSMSYLHGKIDEVRIYNRSLSESEIKELYTQGINDDTCEGGDYQNGYNDGYKAGKDAGIEEGKKYCQENPSACGISTISNDINNCSTFDFVSNTLHIPCFNSGSESYWFDFTLTNGNPVTLQLKKYGRNNQ